MNIDTILLIGAAFCFALAALNVDLFNGKVNFTGLGLLLWVATALI